MYRSSVAVAHPLKSSTCCVFTDALLHATVVNRGYLSYCHLTVNLNQSSHSPLTSLINNAFFPTELPLTGCFDFSHYTL